MVMLYVDIDLSEIDSDDLIDELETREKQECATCPTAERIYELLSRNDIDAALAIVRAWVCEVTGRVLP